MRKATFGFLLVLAALFSATNAANPGQVRALTFTVTNVADSGEGSLRDALEGANANPGTDNIHFNIPGGGPHDIQLQTSLPLSTGNIVLDGTTQPGTSCSPRDIRIRIIATGLYGLLIGPSPTIEGSTIRGVEFSGTATAAQIFLASGDGHVIECSHIGAANGTADGSVAMYGVYVQADVEGVNIGGTDAGDGNVISGNSYGVVITTTDNVKVRGNMIGVDVTGTAAIGNTIAGVTVIGATDISIGGTGASAGNVISGGDYGVQLLPNNDDVPTADVFIAGNKIGTNAAGTAVIANAGAGVGVFGAGDVQIGSAVEGARNIISGNGTAGILVAAQDGMEVNDVEIFGNYIGVGADGVTPLPNSNGASILSGANVSIGGNGVGEGNVISGNTFHGVFVNRSGGAEVAGVAITGNRVGASADGLSAVPNGSYGINLNDTDGHVVRNNIISGNASSGLVISTTTSGAVASGITVQGNRVGYSANESPLPNGGHGISVAIGMTGATGQEDNIIGGVGVGEGNRILTTNPAYRPISLGSGTRRTTVRGNSLITREGQALDLVPTAGDDPRGFTPNSATAGANSMMNHPQVTAANAGVIGSVAGQLTEVAAGTYTIDVYLSRTCDDLTRNSVSFLGTTAAMADGSGVGTFNLVTGEILAGDFITATATDSQGNTSELSPVAVATGTYGPAELRLVPCERTMGWANDFPVRVFGPNFDAGDTWVLTWDGNALPTTRISSTELRATIGPEQVGDQRGTADVGVVQNGTPFEQLTFTIARSSSDTNCDGVLDMRDSHRVRLVIALVVANIGPCNASVLRRISNVPNATDALWVLREIAGLIPEPLLSRNP